MWPYIQLKSFAMYRIVCVVFILQILPYCSYTQEYDVRPKIISEDGNLIILAGFNKNITFKTIGPNSYITFNNGNTANLLSTNEKFKETRGVNQDKAENDHLGTILNSIQGRQGILQRLRRLELNGRNSSNNARLFGLAPIRRRLRNVEVQFNRINRILNTNECLLSPCKNGGECLDLYNKYMCQCPKNWNGRNCEVDVDECMSFGGTDIGCQNGATCINKPGSYKCQCASGWFGIHCTTNSLNCSVSDNEICGHGKCFPIGSGLGVKCLCDPGWTNGDNHPACVVDVNECNEKKSPCSINPPVQCINLQGSFICGRCPAGYEGNGFSCQDIDECQVDNGACSTIPNVQCINTLGSRFCGPCPPGYLGDGTTCSWRGTCESNNGGCHPSAQCVDSTGIGGQFIQCMCPEGSIGDGVGISGCVVTSSNNIGNLHLGQCQLNPCGVHGTCHVMPRGYTCICRDGYGGANCSKLNERCAEQPCKNGGICRSDNNTRAGFQCECSSQYTGALCEELSKACGGFLDSPEGEIVYPNINSTTYGHNSKCGWVIQTNPNKVLNVTFTNFNVEHSQDCNYDWLQIHDGRSSGSHIIGRFCGNVAPNGGNIISSHNSLYFWFRSDQSVAHNGFSLHWESISPICGGIIDASVHGQISSPGSPGTYPPNRDCYWHLSVNAGKRIQIYFFQLDLEAHVNCSFDYLEIFNGLRSSDPLLKKYCNTTQPPPLTSPGPNLLIHFHSDDLNTGRGFQIAYAVTEGIPGCGGLYTTQVGELASPTVNGNYHNNLYCEYNIQVLPGSLIKINFLYFELEDSEPCIFDYLAIYDGGSENSKLVNKFCGKSIPPSFTSSGNELLLILRTDWAIGGLGFRVKYETICYQDFTEENGVITSPGYPNNYPSNRMCKYLVKLPQGKVAELSFNDFDIEDSSYSDECYFDSLSIYDGDNSKSPLIGTYCGDSTTTPPITLSSHNYIYLEFKTDSSLSGTGFSINYTAIDIGCGGIFKDSSGVIAFPKRSLGNMESINYEDSKKCSWLLSAPIGFAIQISWITFDIESTHSCSRDNVNINEIDAETGKVQSIGKYCGERLPPAITSASNMLMVNFTSDETLSKTGFTFSYIFLNSSSLCRAQYVSLHGTLTSPGWPGTYSRNKNCEWTIILPIGQQIILNVTNFYIEDSSSCKHDWLEIRNGGYEQAPLIGKYCGTKIPKTITSLGNAIYLKFHSDYSIQGGGFEINWHETVTGCGGPLLYSSGSLTSPNYPQFYGKNSECYWRISTSAGSAINIHFTDLDLEELRNCQYDYIEFYNGRNNNGPRIGRYCSMKSLPSTIESASNHMYVKFRSDVSNQGKGFSLNYRTNCHRNISGFFGVIESLDFPNEYPNLLDCEWTITAPKGNNINVTFSHFELQETYQIRTGYYGYSPYGWASRFNNPHRSFPHNSRYQIVSNKKCSEDFVTLKDGQNVNITVTLCGKKLPDKFRTRSNILKVNFVTDRFIAFSGFRLEWAVDGCGGILRQPDGTFSPPSNKAELSADLECHWQLITEPGTSIEITINVKQMKTSQKCIYDSVIIYNGPTKESPTLSTICHSLDKSLVVTSSSNYMFVIFNSFSKASNFIAHYKSKQSECGGLFRGYGGEISSPHYPTNYGNNLNCFWTIEVVKNHLIDISFLDFDISGRRGMCKDYLKIFDGTNPQDDGANTTSYCGSTNPLYTTYTSRTNKIVIELKTDDKITAKGFKLKYQIACGARITTDGEGILKNSRAINSREDNNCTWTILAKQLNQRVHVTFTHMDILMPNNITDDCKFNSINVFDGDDIKAPLIGKYCGRKIPPTLVSKGSALTIQLATIYEEILGDFSAHYSVLSTACGGSLTSESGSITSPYYPDTYPFNSDCVWTLQTSPGNQVSFHFEKLDLESSENCNNDYVEIRKNNGVGAMLGVFCGNEIPANSTVGSKVYIKFHSDNDGTAPGFILHYAFVHGNEINNLTQGQIASPLYPQLFTVVGEYYWRVTTSLQTTIAVTIQRFNIYNIATYCKSYFAIYDGYDETAPVLINDCGRKTLDPVHSTSNMLFIKLKLAFWGEGSEFLLDWSEISPDITSSRDFGNPSKCGSKDTILIGRGKTYQLTSPGYPANYENYLTCEWIFSTVEGNHLSIFFSEVDIEETDGCFLDYVNVFTRSKESEKWISIAGNLCLSNVTQMYDLYATDFMKVTFKTDSYLTRKGFSASIISECGGQFTSSSGVIKPNTPQNLFNNSAIWHILHSNIRHANCEWTVRVRPGRTIQLNVENFDIANINENTCENYVMIRNGGLEDSPMLGNGKFCSKESIYSSNLTTTGNWIYIKYVTLHAFVENYFVIRYSEKSLECGLRIALTTDFKYTTISSPNYPNIPPPFSECIWVIMAPVGEILQLEIIDRFDLTYDFTCSKEMLEIRDGGTENSNLIGVFCSEIPSTQKTSGNMLYVRFLTTVNDPKNGFKANISIGRCGGTIRGYTGSLSSPGYPSISNLPPGTYCEWHLIGISGTTLWINFADLDLPASNERCKTNIQVQNILPGNNTLVPLFDTICHDSPTPAAMQTLSHEAVIKFKKGSESQLLPFHDKSYRGFIINFNSTSMTCGSLLEEPSGYIQSSGYPYSLQSSQFCEWKIKVPDDRRITLEILDFDYKNRLTTTFINEDTLAIYDDFRYQVILKNLPERLGERTRIIKSSGSYMVVFYYKHIATSSRGFKAKYTSTEPTLCVGSLNQDNGNIHTPLGDTNPFHCEWTRTASGDESYSNKSFVFNFYNLTMSGRSSPPCLTPGYGEPLIIINAKLSINFERISYQHKLCGNYTSDYIAVRSPVLGLSLTAQRVAKSSLSFNVNYAVQPCGGVVELSEVETLISLPKNHTGSLDCAWLVMSDGQKVSISTEGGFDSDNCESEYLKISDQSSNNPTEIIKYCKNAIQTDSINTNIKKFLIEYHANSFSNKSNFMIKLNMERNGCGGAISKDMRLESPNFPSAYGPNQECIWDIKAEVGFRITLSFMTRFNIENVNNCTKDFVQVFDFKNNTYVGNPKLCGRNLPAPINSTSNRMRVVFRSDESVNADGFRAMWTSYCGGSFEATDELQWMHSPVLDSAYAYVQRCAYKILAKGKFIRISFSQFDLEYFIDTSNKCAYNNVTLVGVEDFEKENNVYCGKTLPPSHRFRDSVTIYFSKTRWVQKFNFNFTYAIDHCHADIKKPQMISSPRNKEGTYDDYLDCHWNITAPDQKIIILKFTYFSLEYTQDCHNDYVSVYDGLKIETEHRLALLCGPLNHSLPLIRSSTNTMSVHFISDFSLGDQGFQAEIVFMDDENSGCGGYKDIQLDSSYSITSPRKLNYSSYKPFLDCQTIFSATPGQVLSVAFHQMHIAPCVNTNQSALSPNNCTCDFLEIRDGGHPNAYLIARYCGHTLPAPIVTSANLLYMRFVSDGTLESSGYRATVAATYSRCGKQYFESTVEPQYINAPRDRNGAILRGLNCMYTINCKENEIIHIIVKQLDMQPPSTTDNICYKDKLEFKIGLRNHNYTHGSEFILQGNTQMHNIYDGYFTGGSSLSHGQVYPMCGVAQLFNIFITNTVSLKVITSAESTKQRYTGFELEMFAAKTCDMNYTAPQYRITLNNMYFKTCTFLIEAPDNYTISLYFIEAKLFSDLFASFIEVLDGKTTDSPKILHSDLSSIDSSPDPVFSTGRYMLVQMSRQQVYGSYMSIDMNYVTTDKGRGCGGRLYNFAGVFTSPMFPVPYRKQAACEWVVETPSGTDLKLGFQNFDLGTRLTCKQHYLELMNRKGQTVATYCSDDDPADHKSDDNYVKVIYHSSVNAGGPGWKAEFSTVSKIEE